VPLGPAGHAPAPGRSAVAVLIEPRRPRLLPKGVPATVVQFAVGASLQGRPGPTGTLEFARVLTKIMLVSTEVDSMTLDKNNCIRRMGDMSCSCRADQR